MTDRLLSLLGLCRRAGRLTLGFDPVMDSINLKKAKLVIVASDCSPHTAKDTLIACHKMGVKSHTVAYTKEEISLAVGKYTAVLSITDEGFSQKADTLIKGGITHGYDD